MAPSRRVISGGSSGSSSRRSGSSSSFPEKLKCDCGGNAVIRTVKKGENIGLKFYGCPKWPDTECNFFRWMDVSYDQELEECRYQLFEKNSTIAELELKYENLEDKYNAMLEKLKKLEGKKGNLSEACQGMSEELKRSSRNENTLAMALFCSWVLIAFLLFSRH